MTDVIEQKLCQLNTYSCHPKRKINVKNLIANNKYKIFSAKRQFKKNHSKKSVIKLELEKSYLYLPKRFNELSDNLIEEINNNDYEIDNRGPWRNTFKLVFSNPSKISEVVAIDSKANDYMKEAGYNPGDSAYYNNNE